MQCDYYDADLCRSCTLMGQPYALQLRDLERHVRDTLDGLVAESAWQQTAFGPESHFRNKAKLVVGGTRDEPTFGILDGDQQGVDLRRCGLYEPGLHDALQTLTEQVARIGLVPYDVPRRTGELKHLVVTHAPTGALMVRFVLRSPGQLGRIRRALPDLQAALPQITVVSVNLQPAHKAVLEGEEEIVLTEHETLTVPLAGVSLNLRPDSFFQTNTAVAEQLYEQAADWVAASGARTLWDLFCGVGGFGLSIGARVPLQVTGVEVAPGAVAAARQSAAELMARNPLSSFDFRVGDAATTLRDEPLPDVVLVNPPRRGIGPLAETLEASGVPQVVYSSCNVESLARDLTRMPTYAVADARVFDMFPQTRHHEVLVRLVRE